MRADACAEMLETWIRLRHRRLRRQWHAGHDDRSRVHGALGWLVEHRYRLLSGIAAGSILVGGALYLAGEQTAGQAVWAAAVALLAAELAVEVVRTVIVDHHMGVDTIALVAMVGALALGEEFAGIIIGLMFSGRSDARGCRLGSCSPGADGVDPARSEGRAAAGR